MSADILLTHDGPVAVVTIHQPAKRNALTQAMAVELVQVFAALKRDDALRCVILRGAGEQAFCAGADIREFGERRGDPEVAAAFDRVFQGAADAIGECPHPVIAAIDGACVGGGLQLAMQCDLRVASAGARFGVPVARLGLAAAWGELKPMVDLAGAAVTLELLLEGTLIDAERALAVGLINALTPAPAYAAAHERAQRIAAGAPLVARWHKQFIRRLLDPRALSAAELAEAYACFATADYREGYGAFLAKRLPQFRGQ
jgi:enoyl-CoA hydratase